MCLSGREAERVDRPQCTHMGSRGKGREGTQGKGAEGKLFTQNWAVLLLWRTRPQKMSRYTRHMDLAIDVMC